MGCKERVTIISLKLINKGPSPKILIPRMKDRIVNEGRGKIPRKAIGGRLVSPGDPYKRTGMIGLQPSTKNPHSQPRERERDKVWYLKRCILGRIYKMTGKGGRSTIKTGTERAQTQRIVLNKN